MAGSYLPRKYREYLGLGAEIALSLAAPILTGIYLDEYLDTSPWLLFLGITVAVILFLFTVIRISKNLSNQDNKK